MTNSIDRPITWDLGAPSHSSSDVSQNGNFETHQNSLGFAHSSADQEQQLHKDAAKLQGLLKPEETTPPLPSTEPPLPDQGTPLPLRPFDLFSGGVEASTGPQAAANTPDIAGIEDNLARMARSLLVGENHRGAEIARMELTSENLPGVVLEVFKDQGAVVAQFVCTNEQSRTRLARAVPWLGESLSNNLSRDTLIRVLTDDPEDPYPVEARHHANPD